MTQRELLIAAIVASVASGQRTIESAIKRIEREKSKRLN